MHVRFAHCFQPSIMKAKTEHSHIHRVVTVQLEPDLLRRVPFPIQAFRLETQESRD